MNTFNVSFHGEIRKNYCLIPHLIWSYAVFLTFATLWVNLADHKSNKKGSGIMKIVSVKIRKFQMSSAEMFIQPTEYILLLTLSLLEAKLANNMYFTPP